jgi:hypothetical protein
MAEPEHPPSLQENFEAECKQLTCVIDCTLFQARAFLLSQPHYYARLCPLPKGVLIGWMLRRRIVLLRQALGATSQVADVHVPLLQELETLVASVEFGRSAPPLAIRTQVRRELLLQEVEHKALRRAFRSMAVINVGEHATRRAPKQLIACAGRLAHNSAAVLSMLLALYAVGQAISSRCIGCSEVGLLTASFFAAWLSYCFFLVGPDWDESNRLLERLGF